MSRAYRPWGVGPARCDIPTRPKWRKWCGLYWGLGPLVPVDFESFRFRCWCWRAKYIWGRPWGQVLLIPYHIILGLYYDYKPREILTFIKNQFVPDRQRKAT